MKIWGFDLGYVELAVALGGPGESASLDKAGPALGTLHLEAWKQVGLQKNKIGS